MKELNKFRQFLNENEDDGYDKASRELFDMTWDEVRRENDPRMKQAVHDEVQKDHDLDYIDDVQESQSISQGFYEVDFIEMDGNEVTRDFRHFTDENEAKQMFNDLKTNPEIVKVTRNELFKGDGENYLGGSEEREYAVNKETDLHRIFLNSRLGDKRFEEPESIMQFFKRKNQAREEFLQNESVNEMKKPTIVVYDGKRLAVDPKDIERLKSGKDIVGKSTKQAGQEEWISAKGKWKVEESLNEFDDKSMKDYGDAMKVALGADKEETSIEKIYMDMLKNELPSQDEVNDAFEKFERETHYLNNKPVGEWDAMDMSNWKSILRKGGKLFMSVKESMARHRVSYTNKDSSKDSQDFIGGLNAEDEFYELMDNDEIISASLEMLRGDKMEVVDTWSRDENGKVSIKLGK